MSEDHDGVDPVVDSGSEVVNPSVSTDSRDNSRSRSPSPSASPVRHHQASKSFEYDVGLSSEGSYSSAAHLSTLNKRNAIFLEQIESLEEKLFNSEEKRLEMQRRLIILEEEAADYHSVADQREVQNSHLRREVDELGIKLQDEKSRFREIDSEKRKLEHKVALLQSEIERNERAKTKLDKSVEDIETLRQKVALLLNEKGDLEQQVLVRQKDVSELEKKLHFETLRSREINNRTIANQESLIETERKRAQQAIDYVRQTLKAKINVLETQLAEESEGDSKFKKEKRTLAREHKLANKKLEDQRSQSNAEARRIETLEKQLETLKKRNNAISQHKSELEQKNQNMKRQLGTLSVKLDSAIFTNAKLNARIPNELRLAVEEEADKRFNKKDSSSTTETSQPSSSAPSDAPLFDTSVQLDTN
eukprot:TRINITY_DN4275_c0_g1_i1.p1 TRINITY_DN4275_c0_g1~~TRINITY_DN4275_c0_g1_i1.p1  ORF type:complete len:420 (-),score=121.98 TRINITY_DN4275_c0_g1_i1:157-1416(-)